MPSRDVRRLKAKQPSTVSEALEKKKTSHPFIYVFSIILLVVVVVTFVGSPIARGIGSVGSIVFGTYEGKDIAYQQGNYFAMQVRNAEALMQSSGQTQDTQSLAYSVWYRAYQQTIIYMAIMSATEKTGALVSTDKVDEAVLQLPQYQENGEFSEDLYNKGSVADRNNTRKLVREGLLQSMYEIDVITGLRTGSAEKQFVAAMGKPERSFQFVSFAFSDFPADEVKKYAGANAEKFRKIKVSRIQVKGGESEAKELLKKIVDKSSSFEDLAKTYSTDSNATSGGDMGWRFSYDLETDFKKKEQLQEVFALKAGELSEVIEGAYGWMFFRCNTEAVNADMSDAETLAEVKNYIQRYEKGKIEDYYTEIAGKLSRRAGEIGFSAAAREAGTKVSTTGYFPINLQSVFPYDTVKTIPESDTLSSAVYSEEFFYRGFSLGKDQASSPIVLDDRIVVLQLLGERQAPESTAKSLDTFSESLAAQSLNSADLMGELMNPEKLKDDFLNTFFTNIYRASSSE
jgi:parvulin-like peptidyl-prolyl isomerase